MKELIENLDAVIESAEGLKAVERELDQRAAGTVYLDNALVHLREAKSNLQNKAACQARGDARPPTDATPPKLS